VIARSLLAAALAASLALVAPVAGCGGGQKGAATAATTPLTPAQIAERSLPSIVLIQAGNRLGTGFLIWQDGRIATNLHVIVGAPSIVVKLPDGRDFSSVEVLAIDERHDLAVIRIKARNLPALSLGDSTKVKAGERVVAIGHPLGLGDTVSDGLVSAIRQVDKDFTVMQISAPIAHGSSGGPLLDDHGDVVGIAFMVSEEGQNLNFAIPVNYLKPMLLSDAGMPFAEFARRTARPDDDAGQPKIQRNVPAFDVKILDDCPMEQVKAAYMGVAQAISLGAPLYNQGNHEACFKIYEGASLDLEKNLQGCAQVKQALADGRTRATGLTSWTEKAWAMRDAFDGLLAVIEKKVGP
jgi:S1-C subfamily serine protease